MSKHIQGIKLAAIIGRRGYAPDIILNTETDEQVAVCANPNLTALFVAAPEMVEALQMFLAYNDQGGPLHFDTDEMWAKARNVLAKIGGGGDE